MTHRGGIIPVMAADFFVRKKLIVDKTLLMLVGAVFVIGLVALYSAGGEERFWRQLGRGVAGIALMFALSYLPLRGQRAAAMIFFVGGILALLAVLAFGIKINNARRWLGFGDFYVQPSEFMKLALPMGLAVWYALTPDAGSGGMIAGMTAAKSRAYQTAYPLARKASFFPRCLERWLA